MSPSLLKKRKRGEEPTEISLHPSSQDTAQVGPVLASFPAIQPTKSIPYRCYLKQKEPNKPFAEQDLTIVGETDSMEFVSSGQEKLGAAAGCSYLVGIHDKRTNTTVFRPAPLHILARSVKKLKKLESIAPSADARLEQINKLGETFGSKKAKAAIRAQERNRIDVDAMKGVASHIQDTIGENTISLPTQEEAKAAANENRLIPPHNLDAEQPDDVYALHDIIPDAELNDIPISALKLASSDLERQKLLPYTRSEWVNSHLKLVFAGPKVRTKTLKVLFYISAMLAFNRTIRGDSKPLRERLVNIPSTIVEGLISRFTETARESSAPTMTSQTKTKLLTHMFALCLRIDDYATDTALVAQDLSMVLSEVDSLFKSLGCKIEMLSQNDLARLGLPSTAAQNKRAILRTPLQFPPVRAKRARR